MKVSIAACSVAALLGAAAPKARGQEAAVELQRVEVVGTTALAETGTPLAQVPANVQTLKRTDLASRKGLGLSDALDRDIGSVNINDTTGNPFQPDVNFRGFTASPVLGTPQGLSVFVDGVRVNETFGDTVNWDLVPRSAIAKITVIPGSSPVFGLNTLGGALSVSTKSGFTDPGTAVRTYGGSFGRRAVEFDSGGQQQKLGWFVTGNSFHDDGWGKHNPSRVQQVFSKASYLDGFAHVDLSATLADNRFDGNQTLPLSLLGNFRQTYTWPDEQKNRLAFINLTAARSLTDELIVSANFYYRKLDSYVLNSNVNNDFDPTARPGPGNEPTGNAVNRINQQRPGGTLQATLLQDVVGHKNHLIVGATVERGHVDFKQSAQEAGGSRDTSSDSPLILGTSLQAITTSSGIYASDSLGLSESTFLSLAGRYDRATVDLKDRLGTALNGSHSFERLNPAAGLIYSPDARLSSYISYSEGARAPTPVELTCADPTAPCSLPNAFSSDPALKAVVSRSVEVGARGSLPFFVNWSAAVFHTSLRDDIQFISSGVNATNAGYFQNVGQTLRQGLELGLDAKTADFALRAHYSYIAATFRSPLVLNSPNNSSSTHLTCPTCTEIQVIPGDRIPGVPHHLIKLTGDFSLSGKTSVGFSFAAQSPSFARGDENNGDRNGAVPGYALLSLNGSIHFAKDWELFATISNLFDHRYATYGVLGKNVFTGPGGSFDSSGSSWRSEEFRSSGIPRGAWVGLTYGWLP